MLEEFLKILGIFLSIIVTIWYVYNLVHISQKEKKIFELKSQIDNLEEDISKKISGSLVNQNQLNKMVERDKKPLMAKLEKLHMERQFILDKLPFIGFFKK